MTLSSDGTSALISIIIPCHNSEKTVEQCLRSLIVQEFKDFEIVCINDGSSDNTLRILEKYRECDRRIIIINQEVAIGAPGSRNIGLEHSKGEYIAFVDSDDTVEPDFLSTLFYLISKNDADLAQVGIRYIFTDRNYTHPIIGGYIEGRAARYRIDVMDGKPFLTPQLWNKLYRKKLFFQEDNTILLKDIIYEDSEIMPRLLKNVEKVCIENKPLYNYFKINSNLTGKSEICKYLPKYLESIRISMNAYIADQDLQERKELGIEFPITVKANFGNILRSISECWVDLSHNDKLRVGNCLTTFVELNYLNLDKTGQEWKSLLNTFIHKNDGRKVYLKKMFNVIKMNNVRNNIQKNRRKVIQSMRFERDLESYDKRKAKDPNLWVFTTYAKYPHALDNSRAVFERVKDIPTIKKVLILNGDDEEIPDYDGKNIEAYHLHSIEGLKLLAQAGVVFTTYSLHAIFGYRHLTNNPQRKIIQLWHGIPVKRIGKLVESENYWEYETQRYHCMPASSAIDQITMAQSFFSGDTSKIILSGLPRHDFLGMTEEDLPEDFQHYLKIIRHRCGGKKMILFAPTWREDAKNNIQFSQDEVMTIIELCKRNDWIFAYRLHPNSLKQKEQYYYNYVSDFFIDMNDIPDINILLRYASGVITDYSSIYLDYMKLMRPVLLYTPDLRKYERQYNYKFEEFSPHEEVNNFEMFINKFKDILEGTYNIDEKYYGVVKRFHKFDLDNKNSTRLLNCLKLLPEGNE